MVDAINNWLPIVTALLGGLLFIWKVTHGLNKTLLTLTNSVDRLNGHLNDVDERSSKAQKRIENHEIRIVIIERELGIKSDNTTKASE